MIEYLNYMHKIKYNLNIYRRYSYWKKAKCIYIHVPKAAGTSINKAVFGRTLGHYKAKEIKCKFPILFSNLLVFSFVRNPWDRVFSAYKFAKIGRTESMGVRNLEQYLIPEFESFELFVTKWLILQDINNLDFIFQPQYSFLYDKNDVLLVDYIGKVETIETGIKHIESKLHKKFNILHANKTSKGVSYREAYVTNEMIEVIRDIYFKDIELFDYEF